MGGDGGDVQRVRKLNREICSNGGWGTGCGNHKVPDARKARGSQDPRGMGLAEMSNRREGEPVETISRG